MPVVYLVRHAQASLGAEDYDALSSLGLDQAAVVGAALAARKPRDPLVVSGMLERQHHTAQLLTAAAGLADPAGRDARWNEYDFLGLLARYEPESPPGFAAGASLQHRLDHALLQWITDDTTDEWTRFADGATAAVGELAAQAGPGRDAIVVTSGGVIAAICGRLLGVTASGIVALNRVTVNASITTLAIGSSGTSLVTFNEHTHFTGPGRALLTYR